MVGKVSPKQGIAILVLYFLGWTIFFIIFYPILTHPDIGLIPLFLSIIFGLGASLLVFLFAALDQESPFSQS